MQLTLNITTLCVLALPLFYLKLDMARLNKVFALYLLCANGAILSWVGFTFTDPQTNAFTLAIWAGTSATLLLFALFGTLSPTILRLSPLVISFCLWMGFWATLWGYHPSTSTGPTWHSITHGLAAHMLLTVLSYGFATLAALAALAAFWVERSLKHKRPTRLSRFLPAILESEALSFRFLLWTGATLGLGFISGLILNAVYFDRLIIWDHKTFFSLASLSLIIILLCAHHYSGLRGRQATRLVLVTYLCLNLGFLGVKFVTSILM